MYGKKKGGKKGDTAGKDGKKGKSDGNTTPDNQPEENQNSDNNSDESEDQIGSLLLLSGNQRRSVRMRDVEASFREFNKGSAGSLTLFFI